MPGLLLWGLATALFSVPGGAREYPLIWNFSSDDVGSDALSFWSGQGADGIIHVAGNTLLTFDGHRWSSTPANSAYGLHSSDFDAKGRLWTGAIDELGWFELTSNFNWQFKSLTSQLPRSAQPLGQVWYTFADNNGATFVTEEKVLRWNGHAFQMWSLPEARRLPTMRVGATLFVHHSTGLYEIGASGPQLVVSASQLGQAMVVWMAARASDLLLVTGDGLMLYGRGSLRHFAPEVSEILARENPTSGAQLHDGRYAFGTHRGGIVIMHPDGTLDRVLTERDGLPTRVIYSLSVDREGALWATSPSHIFRVDMTTSTTVFDTRAGLPELSYRSITRFGDRLFVGAESGLFELQDDAAVFLPSELSREKVHEIRSTEFGIMLAQRRAAWLVNGAHRTALHTTNSDVFAAMPSRRLRNTIYLADNRDIVAATFGGGSRPIVRDLPDIARSIAEDDDGNLWLATISRGILFARPVDGESVEATAVPSSYGLPAMMGRTFARATPAGDVLLFAANGGWIKRAGEQRFRPIRNFPARPVAAVSDFDRHGAGWVVHAATGNTAAGVARVSLTREGTVWEPHSVVGLPMIGAPRSLLVESNANAQPVLWIGGTRSVLRHVVAHGLTAPPPRAPILRAFARASQGQPREFIGAPLPYSTASIELELAAPEFSRLGSIVLQTRIDGIDDAWVPTGREARRELTGVRDGRYVVRARAVAETGVASAPVEFRFQVLPPWWRSAPVVTAAALALLPLGYFGYRWRVRTLRRRNAELELKVRQRTEELEAANAAKTQFVANMSHDIRNPLNGIVGMAIALEDSRLDRHQREMVATLRECTTYLSSLVDDVLDFASIEAGRVELRPGAFAPQELLRSIVATLHGEISIRGALVTIEADPNVPAHVVGDAGRIQQILVNFVSNALKYAGGHIRLAVCLPADAPEEIEFAVIDRGAGIRPEEQAKLFTKFSRLDRARRQNIPGAGLGLAACRLLADLMGGAVAVESRVGEGSRFTLRLPVVETVPALPGDETPLPNTTVLVVEDTDYNAAAAAAVLSKLGLACERARNGAEALRLYQEKRFNIVLLDRNLPDMDGTTVARRIREMESDGRLPAVLLAVTAYCTAEDRKLCLDAGMDAFVGKPLSPEKLRRILLTTGRKLVTTAPVQLSQESDPPAGFDISIFSYLSDGSPAGIEQQIGRHIATLHEALGQLQQAYDAGDFRAARTAAHDLEGYTRMVGATAVASLASQLRLAARAGDSAAFGELLVRTSAETRVLTEVMRQYRPASQPA